MATEKNRIKDIKEKFEESYGTLTPMFAKMRESAYMYANQQWTERDAINSKKKNIPPLVYNMLKKNADVLVGIQRQTRPALKALPEERGDNISASIASRLLHYSMRKGGGYVAANHVQKEQVITGLGWFSPYMDFSDDPVNGEFKAVCDTFSDIFFDPHTREIDLSDCSYLIKRKAVAVDTAKMMFPDFEDAITASKADYKSDYFVMEESGLKNKCLVREMWERVLVPFVSIYSRGEKITIPVELYKKMSAEISVLKSEPDYAEIKHSRKVMRLAISINDEVIVYDDRSPYDGDFFPFIPAFGFYNKSLDTWDLRVMGLLDALKDPQREYNKTKANKNYYMLSSIHSGWMMDKGAVDDVRILTRGMSAPVIQTNPGKSLRRIDPPQLPSVFMQNGEEQLVDIMRIGLNAEALGINSGDQSAKAIKMKNMQGMAGVGELPDNFNTAFINFGKIALSMIYQYYTVDKIRRIIGEEEFAAITEADILKVRDLQYDLEVDDTTFSPVQRQYRLETKLQAAQYNIPGVDIDDIYEDMDYDAADLAKIRQRKAMQQQQAQAMQAHQAQYQQALIASKAQAENAKTRNMDTQTQLMATNVLKNIQELGGQPGDLSQMAGGGEDVSGIESGNEPVF